MGNPPPQRILLRNQNPGACVWFGVMWASREGRRLERTVELLILDEQVSWRSIQQRGLAELGTVAVLDAEVVADEVPRCQAAPDRGRP